MGRRKKIIEAAGEDGFEGLGLGAAGVVRKDPHPVPLPSDGRGDGAAGAKKGEMEDPHSRGGGTPAPGPLLPQSRDKHGRGEEGTPVENRRSGEGDAVAAVANLEPVVREYEYSGETWRVSRYDLLAAEFDGDVEDLGAFHELASLKVRTWTIVRRLYGIRPQVPGSFTDQNDLRVWTREELKGALGLTNSQLKQELDAVRGAWQARGKRNEIEAEAKYYQAQKIEDEISGDELLKKYEFPEIRFLSEEEKSWFLSRVGDFEKLLDEKFAKGMARNALQTEMQMRRLDNYLTTSDCKPGGEMYERNTRLRIQLDNVYRDQITQIEKLCPWAGKVAGKYSFLGVLSDVTKGIQNYKQRGDTKLLDGIHTATELQVLCRRSLQVPEPQYRAGHVVALNAAKAFLWDPKWEQKMPHALVAKMNRAWTAAAMAAGEALGEHLPDLEGDDGTPGAEYEPLVEPSEPERQEAVEETEEEAAW